MSQLFVVSVDVLNVRSKADLSSKKIGQVHKGQKFAILSTDYNWVQVELENGKKGWLYSFYGNFQMVLHQQTQLNRRYYYHSI